MDFRDTDYRFRVKNRWTNGLDSLWASFTMVEILLFDNTLPLPLLSSFSLDGWMDDTNWPNGVAGYSEEAKFSSQSSDPYQLLGLHSIHPGTVVDRRLPLSPPPLAKRSTWMVLEFNTGPG